jgi:hypothetical protein
VGHLVAKEFTVAAGDTKVVIPFSLSGSWPSDGRSVTFRLRTPVGREMGRVEFIVAEAGSKKRVGGGVAFVAGHQVLEGRGRLGPGSYIVLPLSTALPTSVFEITAGDSPSTIELQLEAR